MASRRETLLQNVVTRLDAIRTGAAYHNMGKLKSVQRYVHEWNRDEHDTNLFRDGETILVSVDNETTEADVVDEFANVITLDLWWAKIGGEWNCSDINAALEDMKRALFVGKDVGFGVNATEPRMQNSKENPRTGAPIDGLHLFLTLTYKEELGSPEIGD